MDDFVLITEDELNSRKELTYLLRSHGFKVKAAVTGEEAIEEVMHDHIGVALIDIRLPGINGVEAAFKMREIKPALPLIMVTAFPETRTEAQASSLNDVVWISKPVIGQVARELIEAVSKSIGIMVEDGRKDNTDKYRVIRRGLAMSLVLLGISTFAVLFENGLGIAGVSFSVAVLLFHLYEYWIDTGEEILKPRYIVIGMFCSLGTTIASLIATLIR